MAADISIKTFIVSPAFTKEDVQREVADIPATDIPAFVMNARAVANVVKVAIDEGESRIKAEGIIPLWGRWVDPQTGIVHQYAGTRGDWKVADPRGLRSALAKLTRPDGSRLVEDSEIEAAVATTFKPDHTKLNALAERDPSVREVVDDFRKRAPDGPAHLAEVKA